MARNRTRRGSSARRNYVWTSVILESVTVTTGVPVKAVIVTPDEWQASTTGFKRATLVCIRGWLSVNPLLSTTDFGVCFMAIVVQEEGASLVGPDNVLAYNEGNVLWTAGCAFGANGAALEQAQSVAFDVDVKAKRRIDSGEVVQLVFVGSIANTAQISGVLRGLVQLG